MSKGLYSEIADFNNFGFKVAFEFARKSLEERVCKVERTMK